MWCLAVALPAVQADLGISRADISFAYSLNMLGFFAGGVVAGRLVDRRGIVVTGILSAIGLAAGFALVGPFVAIGLYEVSRRREIGQPVSFGAIWSTIRSRSELGWMAFVTIFIFIMWMYQVRFLMALFHGLNSSFTIHDGDFDHDRRSTVPHRG